VSSRSRNDDTPDGAGVSAVARALEAIAAGQEAAAEARGAQGETIAAIARDLRDVRSSLDKLAAVEQERHAIAVRQQTAEQATAAARWGAVGSLASVVQGCVRYPAVVSIATALGTLALAYLAQRLGLAVPGLPAVTP